MVKLFNVIQQSQSAAVTAVEETKASRGSGKPTLPAPVIDLNSTRKKGGKTTNVPAQGKNGKRQTLKHLFGLYFYRYLSATDTLCACTATLAQDDFLDLIRSGGIVSRA